MRLRFNAPPRHRLEAGDIVIYGGCEAEFADEVGEALLADPHVDVSRVDPLTADEMAALLRRDLDVYAASVGVHDASTLANKDAVIAAVLALFTPPQES